MVAALAGIVQFYPQSMGHMTKWPHPGPPDTPKTNRLPLILLVWYGESLHSQYNTDSPDLRYNLLQELK